MIRTTVLIRHGGSAPVYRAKERDMIKNQSRPVPPSQMADLRDKLLKIDNDVRKLKKEGKDEKQESIEKRWAPPVKSPFTTM